MMGKFSSKRNKDFWDEFALTSKDNKFGASGGKHLVDIENQFIFNSLKTKKSKFMIDIGCGNGQRTLLFSKYSKKTLGMDYSEQMIYEAKKYLKTQSISLQKKINFREGNINKFSSNQLFDTIISCRCIINQTSTLNQIKLFKKLHSMLKPNGSLIIAEISKQGMQRLNTTRKKYDLPPLNKRWHNLHIDEKKIFPKLKNSFKIVDVKRAGMFYFLSRVFYPSMIFPKEPKSESKINELALKSEILTNKSFSENSFDHFGGHLLMHLVKK
jgi:ubiquinone/menaquinone biosynthesis C-methylase UbiE|tara:strand:- start:7 stop:816 length:810 start_codon:yes stop_codon:yes gene_type:complete